MKKILYLLLFVFASCMVSRVSETHPAYYLKGKVLTQQIVSDSIAQATIQIKNTAKHTTYCNISINVIGLNDAGDTICTDAYLTHDSLRPGVRKNYSSTFIIEPGTTRLKLEFISGQIR